jgi:hypothetical protein
MAKTSGGAGRYKGVRTVGGLSVNTTPNDYEKQRTKEEISQLYAAVRGTGTYDETRASLMKSAADSSQGEKIIVRDASGRVVAVTSYRQAGTNGNYLYVGLLGSRGSGGGTAIMRTLFDKVVKGNMDGLGLSALDLARPFYHKMGLYSTYTYGGNMGISRAEIVDQLRRMK